MKVVFCFDGSVWETLGNGRTCTFTNLQGQLPTCCRWHLCGILCVDHINVGVYNFLAAHMCLNASIKKEPAISQ